MPQIDIKLTSTGDTSGFKAIERASETLKQGLGNVAGGVDEMQGSVNKFGQAHKGVMLSAGYQLQDFLIQVQGGQKVLLALAQQGSQFLGVFGPAGAMAGAALAVGSMAAQFFFASESMKKMDDTAKSLAESMQRTSESIRRAFFQSRDPVVQYEEQKRQIDALSKKYAGAMAKRELATRSLSSFANDVGGDITQVGNYNAQADKKRLNASGLQTDSNSMGGREFVDELRKMQDDAQKEGDEIFMKLGLAKAELASMEAKQSDAINKKDIEAAQALEAERERAQKDAQKMTRQKIEDDEKANAELDEAIIKGAIYGAQQEEAGRERAAASAKKQIADAKELETTKAIRAAQVELEAKQVGINQALADSEADFTKTSAEKWATEKRLRDDAVAAARDYLDVMQQIRANALTDADKSTADNGVLGAKKELGSAQRRAAKDTANPNSFFDQIQARMTQMQDQFGTAAEQMADLFASSFTNAASSISSALDGVFTGAITKGQLLRQIGANFGQSMLRSIADFTGNMLVSFAMMPVKWLIAKAQMFAIDQAFSLKGLVLSAAAAAKSLILWLPSAIAASISSFGTAAAIGAAAVGLALVAANNFDVGGYTPGGPKNKAVGTVHAGEWVAPAWMLTNPATADMIAGLESARTGGGIPQLTRPDDGGSRGGSRGGDSSSGVTVNQAHAFFDDRPSAEKWLSSQEGERRITDIARRAMRET